VTSHSASVVLAASDATTAREQLARRLQLILAAAQEGIYGLDLDGRCTFANPAAARMLGYTAEALVGQEIHSLIHHHHPDGSPFVLADCPMWQALQTGEEARVDREQFWRADGTAFPVEYACAPTIEDGEVTGAVVTFSDTTERRRAESEQRFLVEASGILGASLDYEQTLASVLRLAVPRLADWCFIDLVLPDGGSFRRLAVAHAASEKGELAARLQRCCPPIADAPHGVARVVATGVPELLTEPPDTLVPALAGTEEDRVVMRELDVRSYLCVPLRTRGRTLGAITGIHAESGRHYDARDLALVTELARRAAFAVDNARLHEEAKQAVRARDEVLAVVSHDLKNPLSTIMMSADFLLEEIVPDTPERTLERKQLEVMRRSADRANRLIRDLLDAARIEDGKLPIEPRRADPASLIRETVELLLPQAADKPLRLEVDAPDDLPAVCADRDRTLQVLTNLVGNAVKFTPAGGRVVARAAADASSEVRFTITDTGPGLSADELSHLFDRYWQAKKTAKLGTGLGLVIAKGIVEAHGGRIWAESEPGRGSTFHFTLPAA
jgi:PAS domain S-box-containing protein